MKKFTFPLAPAMEWRRTSLHLEEAKMEALYAEMAGLKARVERLREEQAHAEKAVTEEPSVTGAELKRLDSFTQAARLNIERLREVSMACQTRIAAQLETVIQKRRELRLLERLHERKLAAWKTDFARELDREAEELHLSRFPARYPEY